jgi:hypothetical protein
MRRRVLYSPDYVAAFRRALQQARADLAEMDFRHRCAQADLRRELEQCRAEFDELRAAVLARQARSRARAVEATGRASSPRARSRDSVALNGEDEASARLKPDGCTYGAHRRPTRQAASGGKTDTCVPFERAAAMVDAPARARPVSLILVLLERAIAVVGRGSRLPAFLAAFEGALETGAELVVHTNELGA